MIKKRLHLSEIHLLLLLGAFYIIPMGFVANSALYIVPMSVCIAYVIGTHRISRLDNTHLIIFTLLGMMFACSILFGNTYNLFQILFLIIAYLILGKNPRKETQHHLDFLAKATALAAVASMGLQLFHYRIDTDTGIRIVSSIGDPNFTGVMVLGLFLIAHKLKIPLSTFLVMVAALAIESRGLIIALIFFYIIRYTKPQFERCYRVLLHPYTLFIVGNLATYILSIAWIDNVTSVQVHYATGLERWILNDASNYGRFTANLIQSSELISRINEFLFGIPDFEERIRSENQLLPHNSFLYTLRSSGLILSVIYFSVVLRMMKKYSVYENREYITSFFVFSYFIHGMFSGFFMLIFLTAFSLSGSAQLRKKRSSGQFGFLNVVRGRIET